jgi:hypothetical protein
MRNGLSNRHCVAGLFRWFRGHRNRLWAIIYTSATLTVLLRDAFFFSEASPMEDRKKYVLPTASGCFSGLGDHEKTMYRFSRLWSVSRTALRR